MTCPRPFALVLLLAASPAATAAPPSTTDCEDRAADCVAVGRWDFSVSLGAGVRTNPLAQSTNIPLVVIPHVSYYGQRVFLDNLDLGVTLAENDGNSLNLVASPGYDRVFFYRSDLQNIFVEGLPASAVATYYQGPANIANFPPRPRKWTYLAGPEWTFSVHGVTGQVDLLHDVTGRNDGTEVRAALALPLIETNGTLTATLGATWKSASIVNYYYGQSSVYDADAALSPFAKLAYRRPLGKHWQLTALFHYERLGNSIAYSPIVAEHYVATAFAGATCSF